MEEIRLSHEEIQAVLLRLRGAEESLGTTVADLSEATGIPSTQVAEVLALVRQEKAPRLSDATAVRNRRALQAAAFIAVWLAAVVALMNAPFFQGPRVTVTKVGAHRVVDSYGQDTHGTKVEVRLEVHPQTLWNRLVGTVPPFRSGSPSLFTPEGEVQSVQLLDGSDHPVFSQTGDLPRTPSGEYQASYEYPDVPATRRATRLRDQITVEGEVVDLDVPLLPLLKAR